jgi:hypothetical protein
MLKRFLKDETGLELSEYAVAAALVALAAVVAFQTWVPTSAPRSPTWPQDSVTLKFKFTRQGNLLPAAKKAQAFNSSKRGTDHVQEIFERRNRA